MSVMSRLLAHFDKQTDSRPVAYVRAVIGIAALLRAQEAWQILSQVLISPLRLPYVPGLPDLPSALLPLLIGFWALAALAFTFGWKTRTSGTLLVMVMVYVLCLDQQSYSNHLYLLSCVTALLTIGDAGATFSLDARRQGTRPTVPLWPVTLLRCQLSLVYGLGAIAKIVAPTYLNGTVLAAYLNPAFQPTLHSLPAATQGTLLVALSLLSIAVELFLAIGFWFPRLRWLCVGLGLALHGFMIAAISPEVGVQIQVFAVVSIALYPLFVPLPLAPSPAEQERGNPEGSLVG